MTTPIDIRADHLRVVQDVLRRHLPEGVQVWVFGSRATWATKDSSDLDLALEGDGEVPARSLFALEAAFEDSDLPYAVDIVDAKRIGERFRRIVVEQRVPLPMFPRAGTRHGCADGRADTSHTDLSSGTREEWVTVRLGDVADLLTGFPFRSDRYMSDSEAPRLLRGDNVAQGRLRWHGAKRWSAEAAAAMEQFWLSEGDVVLAMDRPWIEAGLKFASVRRSDLPALLVQRVARLRGSEDLDTRFLRYVIGCRDFSDYVLSVQTGTAVPHLSAWQIEDYEFRLPPVRHQRAIGHILGTLDDKIELNRRMSATLEAIARALFRSWFIDFDPVRAKLEGRDTGLPKEIADLFPDRLVESQTSEIPKGWPLVPLTELMEVNPPRSLRRGEIAPYLDMANMPARGHAPESVVQRPFNSGMRFRNGDTLVARITPCLENGKTAYVDFLRDGEIGWGSTEYIVMRPRHPLPSEFAYFLARTARFREFAIRNMSGTSGRQRVPAAALSGFSLPLPPAPIGVAFGRAAELLLGRARAAVDECTVLAKCRDALLPKLVSGETRVRDAQNIVGVLT